MSSRLVGLVLEHYPVGGSEFTLAIVLADEADHRGGLIPSPLSELARLSRQSECNARRLIQKMETSTWLVCRERSRGGHSRPSIYQINPEWVRLPLGFRFGQQPSQVERDEPSQLERDEPSQNPRNLRGFPRETSPFADPASSLFKSITPLTPQTEPFPTSGSAVPSATAAGVDLDLRLAQWMFGLILELNPKHREPPWRRWCRDIRVMTGKGHSHRDIAELFKWANDDRTPHPGGTFCWATNILSPAKLWVQWDQLTTKRNADPASRPAPAVDPKCSVCHERPWSIMQGKAGARVCGPCFDLAQRVGHKRVAA